MRKNIQRVVRRQDTLLTASLLIKNTILHTHTHKTQQNTRKRCEKRRKTQFEYRFPAFIASEFIYFHVDVFQSSFSLLQNTQF